jgi:hypothetical protein
MLSRVRKLIQNRCAASHVAAKFKEFHNEAPEKENLYEMKIGMARRQKFT